MPRLRTKLGVIINVSDEKAARLGTGYAPVSSESSKAAPKKRAAKKSE